MRHHSFFIKYQDFAMGFQIIPTSSKSLHYLNMMIRVKGAHMQEVILPLRTFLFSIPSTSNSPPFKLPKPTTLAIRHHPLLARQPSTSELPPTHPYKCPLTMPHIYKNSNPHMQPTGSRGTESSEDLDAMSFWNWHRVKLGLVGESNAE
jgi:hypothetical protein